MPAARVIERKLQPARFDICLTTSSERINAIDGIREVTVAHYEVLLILFCYILLGAEKQKQKLKHGFDQINKILTIKNP